MFLYIINAADIFLLPLHEKEAEIKRCVLTHCVILNYSLWIIKGGKDSNASGDPLQSQVSAVA